MNVEQTITKILSEDPCLNLELVYSESTILSDEFRRDRVRLFMDKHNKIVSTILG